MPPAYIGGLCKGNDERMLFRRREQIGFWEKARVMMWPRRSFVRSFQYFTKRILRLTATPHAIAAGVAAGVLASFSPFVGLHFILAFAIAYVAAGNMVAAALGTAAGNPLTFPFIWGVTYELGHVMTTGEHPANSVPVVLIKNLMHLDLVALWTPLLKPMLLGGLVIGIPASILSYILTRWAVASFQHRRRKSLEGKAAHRKKTIAATAIAN